jgi:Holliday junction DNA helicase RuvB
VANRLLKRVRDHAQVHGNGVIYIATAGAALDLLEVDHEGLDRLDREILSVICTRFGGGPVGLSTLAVAVQEEQDTIEDVYEPYLLQRGFLQRTPRGRCATPHAFRHLGLDAPAAPPVLF